MSLTRIETLSLYRRLMRLSGQFSIYNYREYARRRVRDAFRANKLTTDPAKLSKLHSEAAESVGLLQRQTRLTEMYGIGKLVLEL